MQDRKQKLNSPSGEEQAGILAGLDKPLLIRSDADTPAASPSQNCSGDGPRAVLSFYPRPKPNPYAARVPFATGHDDNLSLEATADMGRRSENELDTVSRLPDCDTKPRSPQAMSFTYERTSLTGDHNSPAEDAQLIDTPPSHGLFDGNLLEEQLQSDAGRIAESGEQSHMAHIATSQAVDCLAADDQHEAQNGLEVCDSYSVVETGKVATYQQQAVLDDALLSESMRPSGSHSTHETLLNEYGAEPVDLAFHWQDHEWALQKAESTALSPLLQLPVANAQADANKRPASIGSQNPDPRKKKSRRETPILTMSEINPTSATSVSGAKRVANWTTSLYRHCSHHQVDVLAKSIMTQPRMILYYQRGELELLRDRSAKVLDPNAVVRIQHPQASGAMPIHFNDLSWSDLRLLRDAAEVLTTYSGFKVAFSIHYRIWRKLIISNDCPWGSLESMTHKQLLACGRTANNEADLSLANTMLKNRVQSLARRHDWPSLAAKASMYMLLTDISIKRSDTATAGMHRMIAYASLPAHRIIIEDPKLFPPDLNMDFQRLRAISYQHVNTSRKSSESSQGSLSREPELNADARKLWRIMFQPHHDHVKALIRWCHCVLSNSNNHTYSYVRLHQNLQVSQTQALFDFLLDRKLTLSETNLDDQFCSVASANECQWDSSLDGMPHTSAADWLRIVSVAIILRLKMHGVTPEAFVSMASRGTAAFLNDPDRVGKDWADDWADRFLSAMECEASTNIHQQIVARDTQQSFTLLKNDYGHVEDFIRDKLGVVLEYEPLRATLPSKVGVAEPETEVLGSASNLELCARQDEDSSDEITARHFMLPASLGSCDRLSTTSSMRSFLDFKSHVAQRLLQNNQSPRSSISSFEWQHSRSGQGSGWEEMWLDLPDSMSLTSISTRASSLLSTKLTGVDMADRRNTGGSAGAHRHSSTPAEGLPRDDMAQAIEPEVRALIERAIEQRLRDERENIRRDIEREIRSSIHEGDSRATTTGRLEQDKVVTKEESSNGASEAEMMSNSIDN